MRSKIDISHKTILFILGLGIGLWFLIQIKEIIFLLFIAFIVMSALRPMVEYLEHYHIPRSVSIMVIYIVVIGGIGTALSSLIPLFIHQSTKFFTDFPHYVASLNPMFQVDFQTAFSQIAPIGQNVLRVTFDVFTNALTMVTVLVFTFYLLLERKHFESYMRQMLSEKHATTYINMLKDVEFNLGSWLRGEFILMFCIGLLSFIALTILHIEYALPLAIIAGLLEIVPVIGPIMAAVPAVIVALTISPLLALFTALAYFIIQQFENNAIVPFVMKRATGISPLITILSIMIGSRLAGIVGAILAVPVYVVVKTLIASRFGMPDENES